MTAFRQSAPAPGLVRRRRAWLVAMLFPAALAGCHGDQPEELTGDEGCAPMDPVPARIWRQSVQQYSNSVRDLLALPTTPDLGTMGGQATYAFFSDETLTVDPQLAYNMNTMLRTVLAGISIPQLAACKSGEAEADCAQ